MAYLRINKKRFGYLLSRGLDSNELRRFFTENRSLLIMKGARVQNLPSGPEAALTTMENLPAGTDAILQKWFSKNITMIDPESVDELIDMFSLYEEIEEENLTQTEAKKFARSCLIHLFSENPSQKLIEFLKSQIGKREDASDTEQESTPDASADGDALHEPSKTNAKKTLREPELVNAVVALLEGRAPDEYLSGLPSYIASLISALYAIKTGNFRDIESLLDGFSELESVKEELSKYAEHIEKTNESQKQISTGIELMQLEEFEDIENVKFDFNKDRVFAKCTKNSSERAVFLQPFVIRTFDGKLFSLEKRETRETLFPQSGDVQAFSGASFPNQPAQGEIGIWRIAPNEKQNSENHRNNFHLKSKKTEIYEIQLVPFFSTEYDSVREFIKQNISKSSSRKLLEPCLFLLRDNLIVGCASGKDMTKDDGFDDGLPCWRSLPAFLFEGRMLVPGPLPASELYECATVASTLKKILSSKKASSEKLTKAQLKGLIESVNAEGGRLNASRQVRLLEELKYMESEDTIGLLVEEAMKHEKISSRVEQLIIKKVDEHVREKNTLLKEIGQLENQRNALRENIAKQEEEQRALPSAISKAIKDSIKKSRDDVLGTLGQVVVFKALMDEWSNFGGSTSTEFKIDHSQQNRFMKVDHDATPLFTILKSLGISAKHAKALELTGALVLNTGMVLVIEGVVARLAAEAWGRNNEQGCVLMYGEIGLADDREVKDVIVSDVSSVVILDANLSPLDIYARPLIDIVQRRIAAGEGENSPKIVISLSNGVASLPLPDSIKAIGICISLDEKPVFFREEDVADKLLDVKEGEREVWAELLWPPALDMLLKSIESLPAEDAALVLSILSSKSLTERL